MTPEAYAQWRSTWLGATTERLEQVAVFELAGSLEGLCVLDAGCGDGTYAIGAAARGADVTGVDLSAEVLRAARRRAVNANVQIALIEADVRKLPFADESFDVALAITVLCFVEDVDAALAELARVLRPGGRLIIGELGRSSTWAAWRRIRAWLGSETWRNARFWSVRELQDLVQAPGLVFDRVRGCVYYPPLAVPARVLAPFDRTLGHITTAGAAFIVVSATKEHGRAS